MEDLLRRLDQLRPLFGRNSPIVALDLFGSQVEGYVMPRNDIDLVILWSECAAPGIALNTDVVISMALGTDRMDVVKSILQTYQRKNLLSLEHDNAI